MKPDLSCLNRSLKRSKVIKVVMEAAGGQSWLVGGYVRDLFITGGIKRGKRDLDFIVSESPTKVARALRRLLGGTLVNLREESIIRLVLPRGDVIDLSMLVTGIRDDLESRDFSMNAIAWSPSLGFLDPNNGISDITSCKIRHISSLNLKSDPLRLLRAYRLKALTGFTISKETRSSIRHLSTLAASPARERITYELIKIIQSKYASEALSEAIDDRVLTSITGLSKADLRRKLDLINLIKTREGWVTNKWLSAKREQGMDNSSALMLSTLLKGANMECFSFGRDFIKRFRDICKYFSDFESLEQGDKEGIFRMLSSMDEAYIDLALITGKKWALKHYERYSRHKGRPLVSARELIELYQIEEGPAVGKILRRIEKERFLGHLSKKSDISSWIRISLV
jgi:tRNA nucleotidyltransferase/poly(A) polymerase